MKPKISGKKMISPSTKPKNGKKKRKAVKPTYNSYIFRVLKQIHPETGISARAVSIMNSLVIDIMDRIATEAIRLNSYNSRKILTSREIQTVVRLIFPVELAKHGNIEAGKALNKFNDYKKRS